jgi:lipid II:glycine glycyltransferase (peptidoglycan interpeptide bridge formation enzyme)
MVKAMYPRYFLQTQTWADFWLKTQVDFPGHHAYVIPNPESYIIYEYPWHFGIKMWYVPKLFVNPEGITSQDEFKSIVKPLLQQLFKKARDHKVDFVKFELDSQPFEIVGIKQDKVYDFIENLTLFESIQKSKKTLQFLQTSTIDCSDLKGKTNIISKQKFDSKTLREWYDANKVFWKQRNNNIQRYTKKSIDNEWLVSTEKTKANFEKFYQVYTHTKDRQNFAIHSKDYLQKLYTEKFSRVIILSDAKGEAQCVWLGIMSEQTLTYHSGGNTNHSFTHKGQYLAHLIALIIAQEENLNYYDLGGYDPNLGFGKFKEGYRGNIRTFPGPFDVVLNPVKYYLVHGLMWLKSLFKG